MIVFILNDFFQFFSLKWFNLVKNNRISFPKQIANQNSIHKHS